MTNQPIHAIYQMHKQPVIDLALEARIKHRISHLRRDPVKLQARSPITESNVNPNPKKALTLKDTARRDQAIRWLVAALVDSVLGGKRRSVVVPFGHQLSGLQFGYKLIRPIIEALESLRYITVKKARPSRYGGYASEILASKGFAIAYSNTLISWVRHPSDLRIKELRLTDRDDFLDIRFSKPIPVNSQTDLWAKNLRKINDFNQTLPIFLFEEDTVIREILSESNVSFNATRYHRGFCRGSLKLGGRFYGPWWQCIRSEYRSTISINLEPVVEYDFSAMAINLLYSKIGIDPPEDPYDLGLSPENYDEKRRILKKFVLAILNDKGRNFRLGRKEAKTLNVTHERLLALLEKKHPKLTPFFHTHAGLDVQFLDSQIAETIMLKGIDRGVLVLSVHDSFLTQERHEKILVDLMEETYLDQVGRMPEIRKDGHRRPLNSQLDQQKSHCAAHFHETFRQASARP